MLIIRHGKWFYFLCNIRRLEAMRGFKEYRREYFESYNMRDLLAFAYSAFPETVSELRQSIELNIIILMRNGLFTSSSISRENFIQFAPAEIL